MPIAADTSPPDHRWISTHVTQDRRCGTCTHWHGRLSGHHVVCQEGGKVQVIGVAAHGCAFWMRAAGADD
jgi:hypothetical protein